MDLLSLYHALARRSRTMIQATEEELKPTTATMQSPLKASKVFPLT